MSSRHQPQTLPTARPPATPTSRFGNVLGSFHSLRTRSNKISPLFSMTSLLFVTLKKISPLFAHSSQKHPRYGAYCLAPQNFAGQSKARSLPRASRGRWLALTSERSPSLRHVSFFCFFVPAGFSAEKPSLPPLHHMAYTRDVMCLGEANHATQFS